MTAESIPESRSYRHSRCGQETLVSGESFSVVSNPLADMTRTWCTPCHEFFPVSEYEWADTDEKIVDYYKRHSAKATATERLICSKPFLFTSIAIGLLIGVGIGLWLTPKASFGQKCLVSGVLGFVGVFLTAALNISVISTMVIRRVCGVSDTRLLK